MKYIAKKQDGYVLAYVLIVVMVVGIIAVAACTTAIRNHDAQIETLSYTKDKYEAEGVVERFVAEFEVAAVEVAESVSVNPGNADTIEEAIRTGLNAKLGDGNPEPMDGIVDGILKDGYDIEVQGEVNGFVPYTYEDESGTLVTSSERGYFPAEAQISAKAGTAQINAVFELQYYAGVKTSGGISSYQVTGVSFEYTSYRVSTVPEGGADDAEE